VGFFGAHKEQGMVEEKKVGVIASMGMWLIAMAVCAVIGGALTFAYFVIFGPADTGREAEGAALRAYLDGMIGVQEVIQSGAGPAVARERLKAVEDLESADIKAIERRTFLRQAQQFDVLRRIRHAKEFFEKSVELEEAALALDEKGKKKIEEGKARRDLDSHAQDLYLHEGTRMRDEAEQKRESARSAAGNGQGMLAEAQKLWREGEDRKWAKQ
jgi:hypothetical protein